MHKVVEPLTWDSAFFGFKIGRVMSQELTPELASVVDEEAQLQAIKCVYLLLNANDMDSIRVAERRRYGLYDIRMTFERSLSDTLPILSPMDGISLRDANEEDLEELRLIAHNAYVLSRFYNDTRFDKQRCALLYEEWITKSVMTDFADTVRLAVQDKSILGYVTYQVDALQRTAKIGLVGVAEFARGRHVGTVILNDALHNMVNDGITSVSVVTQGSNIAGQRLYQRSGFLSHDVQLWYHKWFTEYQEV